MRLLLFIFLTLLLITSALAQQGHLTLLTVSEGANETGGTADLYLEIKPGTGQIFIDTFPLTRLDTQSSTRYANQRACAYLDRDCSNYDFFYTIRADSAVVGGPSAGGAVAVLTAMLLDNKPVDETIAMTGTINSGGIIGPVAGIEAKAQAAADKGMRLLLLSEFSYPSRINSTYLDVLNSTENQTINFSRLSTPINLSDLPIDVRQVSSLGEAIAYFSGGEPEQAPPAALTIDPDYTAIMKDIADRLCERHEDLRSSLALVGHNTTDVNFTIRLAEVQESEDWYSAASYCYADLIDLRTLAFSELSNSAKRAHHQTLMTQVNGFQYNLEKKNITTMAELETSMIVSERLKEAAEHLTEIDLKNISARRLAVAYERYNSANVWSSFFVLESAPIALNERHLATACTSKLIEAEERISYAELYLPEDYLQDARAELGFAFHAAEAGYYPNCLFAAAKAQASAELLSTTVAVPNEKVEELLEKKLAAVATIIQGQQEKGYFPIVGYSYYQYAKSLGEHDSYSALTFAEYALELSSLDRFFPRKRTFTFNTEYVYVGIIFLSGIVIGTAIGFPLGKNSGKKPIRKKKSSRKSRK